MQCLLGKSFLHTDTGPYAEALRLDVDLTFAAFPGTYFVAVSIVRQTSNSMNLLVKGDVIFCDYGCTAEDDYLYQLDKNTGEVIDRLPLKKMPDLMAVKDDRL